MRVLIIEDEPLLAKKLQKLIAAADPTAQVEGVVHGVEEAVQWWQTHPAPDLVFMDIELNDGQSFDIFNRVEIHTPVIFTTAYDEYAIKAFKVNSVDYLLKPIRQEALQDALEKFKRLHAGKSAAPELDMVMQAIRQIRNETTAIRDRFLVKTGQKMIPIDVRDIAYFYSESGISFLRTKTNQRYPLDYTLDELEKMLSEHDFRRANRQYILSRNAVTAVHLWFNGKLKVDVHPEPEEAVIISREKAAAFRTWMGA